MESTIYYSDFDEDRIKLLANLSTIDLKINSFGALEKGWHYGKGFGPSEKTIDLAKKIIDLLHLEFFCKVDAFPGIEEEIQVTGYPDGYFLEINILKNHSIELVIENSLQEEILDLVGLSYKQLVSDLRFFKQNKLWRSFVYFPQNILIKTYPDSPVSPFGILQVHEEESHYLTKSAQAKIQEVPVHTLADITNPLATSHLFFGNSVQTNYQVTQA